MSGGSHGYVYGTIRDYLCDQMKDAELNDLVNDLVKVAHDLEWADSSDISEETYFKTVREFKQKWFGTCRTDRLIGYVDKRIEEVKEELHRMVEE